MNWSPNSWRSKNAKHIPNDYPSIDALAEVENTLSKKPPLVVASEIEKLKKEKLALKDELYVILEKHKSA